MLHTEWEANAATFRFYRTPSTARKAHRVAIIDWAGIGLYAITAVSMVSALGAIVAFAYAVSMH